MLNRFLVWENTLNYLTVCKQMIDVKKIFGVGKYLKLFNCVQTNDWC